MKKHYLIMAIFALLCACEPVVDDDKDTDLKDDPELIGQEAVDLGLSVKWGTCNIGAENPFEYGGLFAWGEMKARHDFSDISLYKYEIYGDVAQAALGGKWRMPKAEEWKELKESCEWKWTGKSMKSGYVYGFKVTGPSGNSIFLPAAGSIASNVLQGDGSNGHYWSSTLSTKEDGRAWTVSFFNFGPQTINPEPSLLSVDLNDAGDRRFGRSIRPVYDDNMDGQSREIIEFADRNAELSCIVKWDADADLQLSYSEAAAVKSFGQLFVDEQISSFDELQYFTGVTDIMHSAFSNCSKLKSIVIPHNVKTIHSAFIGCNNLENVIITGSSDIDDLAFYECENLSSLSLLKAADIGKYAFSDCNKLLCINMPEGIKNVGEYAFLRCPAKMNIEIVEGAVELGQGAFAGCIGLESVIIPSSVSLIDHGAFSGCANLKSIVITEGVEAIQGFTFFECRNLTEITIPKSIKSIGTHAFDGAGLKYITFLSSLPPKLGEECPLGMEIVAIYVPAASIDAYKTAQGWWSLYAEFIQPIQ